MITPNYAQDRKEAQLVINAASRYFKLPQEDLLGGNVDYTYQRRVCLLVMTIALGFTYYKAAMYIRRTWHYGEIASRMKMNKDINNLVRIVNEKRENCTTITKKGARGIQCLHP